MELNISGGGYGQITKVLNNGMVVKVIWDCDTLQKSERKTHSVSLVSRVFLVFLVFLAFLVFYSLLLSYSLQIHMRGPFIL